MARRRKGRAVHGWLSLDKPAGMTSMQAVTAVRRLFDARKAGHAGTLDPLATGVLPIALGEATKTVSYAMEGKKHYRFTVRWGAEMDTDDCEGRAVASSELRPDPARIEAMLPRYIGEILQAPPAYSAIKIDGERAYAMARAGEAVELEARPVVIDALELHAAPDRDTAIFEAQCGKGTYVRALARDIGRALGCYGHVTALRRTAVGAFDEAGCITLDRLRETEAGSGAGLDAMLLPIVAALQELVPLNVAQSDAARLLSGQAILIRGRDAPIHRGAAYAVCKGNLVAVGQIERGELRPVRVFNFSEPN
jgi:tRNA pseudouridine55 synthase